MRLAEGLAFIPDSLVRDQSDGQGWGASSGMMYWNPANGFVSEVSCFQESWWVTSVSPAGTEGRFWQPDILWEPSLGKYGEK